MRCRSQQRAIQQQQQQSHCALRLILGHLVCHLYICKYVYIMLLTGLGAQWRKELASMPQRITAMRTKLRAELEACSAAGSWNHITDQVRTDMISFNSLTSCSVTSATTAHRATATARAAAVVLVLVLLLSVQFVPL
jgi:hypothetical protein